MASELKNILINRISEKYLKKIAPLYLKGKLIDIGCGIKPYKEMFAPYISEHIGVDHPDGMHDKSSVNILSSAYEIPVANASFDAAICNAVLEHLEEPEKAIAECYRILKPGSFAIYTVPFIWHVHEEPRDFYRYTKYGLKYLFEKVGFEIVDIHAMSGFWVTFGQLMVYNIYRFCKGPIKYTGIIQLMSLIIQGFSYILDKVDKSERWTWSYTIVAKKH